MNYILKCTITDIFERLLKKHVSGAGAESIFSSASIGWYIQLDDIISIYVGDDRPAWNIGDKIELILRKP